jgi:hypothetical protein
MSERRILFLFVLFVFLAFLAAYQTHIESNYIEVGEITHNGYLK